MNGALQTEATNTAALPQNLRQSLSQNNSGLSTLTSPKK